MKKFFKYLFVFILIPITLICLLEIVIVKKKDILLSEKSLEMNLKNESGDYMWIDNLKTDTICVLAGSSSVRYGLSCKELNRLSQRNELYINLAMDARDPISTYFILKTIVDSKIKKVYLGLDPWIFAKSYYKARENYLYLDFSFKEVILYTLEHDKSAILKRYRSLLSSYFTKDNKNLSAIKKIPLDYGSVTLEHTATNFNQPINEWFQIEEYGWSDLQFEYLKRIEELCKLNSIDFYLFIPPKRSDFNITYKEDCQKVHSEFINNLSLLSLDTKILGSFDLLEKAGDSQFFTEAYHLNKTGQIYFSKEFYWLSQDSTNMFNINTSWFLE